MTEYIGVLNKRKQKNALTFRCWLFNTVFNKRNTMPAPHTTAAPEKMKFMGVRIPPALQRRMDARLKKDGLGVSEYIRELIRRDLDAREEALRA